MSTKNIHVGKYLENELFSRGWTTRDCAERMGGDVDSDELKLDLLIALSNAPPGHAGSLIRIGVGTATGLSIATETSVELWLNLDAEYHRKREEQA